MTTVAIKEKLIHQIQKTKNLTILQEVSRLLEIDETDMDILKLSEPQRGKMLRAEEDIRHGRVISDEEIKNEVKKWLKK